VSNIDPFKCTHLIYAFVGLEEADGSTIKLLNPNTDPDNMNRFNALKTLNPMLKTLVAIGGWNEGSSKYSRLAADPQMREVFAADAKNFVLKYGFDGLDIDWEYPGILLCQNISDLN
jgi:chitinase